MYWNASVCVNMPPSDCGFEVACEESLLGLSIPLLAAVFHVRDQAGDKLQDPLLMSYIQQVRSLNANNCPAFSR